MTKKYPFLPIFLTVFFGYIGVSLPYAFFPPLFLYSNGGMFSPEMSVGMRSLLLGLALAIYPFGQFFGSPILGRISDFFGRKPVLLTSLCITGFGYFLTAIAVTNSWIFLLFFSRLLCGFAEGNVLIAQATAADLAEGHRKVRSFSFIIAAISLGFIVGPIIGGKLADPSIVSWFSYSTPFWFAIVISLITILTVALFFPVLPRQRKKKGGGLFKGMFVCKEGLSIPGIRPLFASSFFIYFILVIFFLFIPVYMARSYESPPGEIATMQAYFAFFLAMVQLVMGSVMAKRLVPYKMVLYTNIPLIFLMLLFALPLRYESLFLILPVPTICIGLAVTGINLLISNRASKKLQGEVMGINTSLVVAAETICSIIGGFLAGFAAFFPFLTGSVAAIIVTLILLKKRKLYI